MIDLIFVIVSFLSNDVSTHNDIENPHPWYGGGD